MSRATAFAASDSVPVRVSSSPPEQATPHATAAAETDTDTCETEWEVALRSVVPLSMQESDAPRFAMTSSSCIRGPIVFSLLAIRFPRTTPANPRSGSTAIAGPVHPVWQIARSENPVAHHSEKVDDCAVMSQPKLRR